MREENQISPDHGHLVNGGEITKKEVDKMRLKAREEMAVLQAKKGTASSARARAEMLDMNTMLRLQDQ